MARSARDLSLAFDLLVPKGPAQVVLPSAELKSTSELRVAVWREDPAFPREADVAEVMSDAVERLSGAGFTLEEQVPAGPSLGEVLEIYVPLLSAVIGTGLPATSFRRLQWTAPLLRRMARLRVTSEVPGLFMEGVTQTHRSWLSYHEKRARVGARVAEWFETFDLLITPVAPWAAFPHAHNGEILLRTIAAPSGSRAYADHLGWVGLATLLGLPATSVPMGRTASGLPVGLQVMGPRFHDHRCLAAARRLEDTLGGFTPPSQV